MSFCDICKSLDFSDATTCMTQVSGNSEYSYKTFITGRLLAATGTAYHETTPPPIGCPMCPLLRAAWIYSQAQNECPAPRDNVYVFPPFRGEILGLHGMYGDDAADDTYDGTGVLIVSMNPMRDYSTSCFYASISAQPAHTVLLAVDPSLVPTEFDSLLSRRWLAYCVTKHDCQVKGMEPRYPITLIDCQTRRLVQGARSTAYFALSYVWSKTVSEHVDFGQRALPESISAVVHDAMEVTKSMGYQYLWVDRYCINQKDPDAVTQQVGQMDEIYLGADMTIVAAAGQDEDSGLVGVNRRYFDGRKGARVDKDGKLLFPIHSCDPQHNIQTSTWSSRGWTFQESLLSRRRLVFTQDAVWFECGEMSCWRRQDLQLPVSDAALDTYLAHCTELGPLIWAFPRTNAGLMEPRSTAAIDAMDQVWKYINDYTKRDLSFESDSLPAFQGVLNRIHYIFNGQIMHAWGVPFYNWWGQHDERGIMRPESLFKEHLCWTQSYGQKGVRRHAFPSWSWAGWGGEKVRRVPPLTHPRSWLTAADQGRHRATLHSIKDGRRGAKAVLDMEARFLDQAFFCSNDVPKDADGGILTDEWRPLHSHAERGNIFLRPDSHVVVPKLRRSRHSVEAIPPLGTGVLRACILYRDRGGQFYGLLVGRVSENAAVYCRVGSFEMDGSRAGFDGESDQGADFDQAEQDHYEAEMNEMRPERFLLE